jgi:hypothetical protein
MREGKGGGVGVIVVPTMQYRQEVIGTLALPWRYMARAAADTEN